jgi:hypothetical protein
VNKTSAKLNEQRREVLAHGSLVGQAPRLKGPLWLPRKIVSGGQTGVDRAALDWAISIGIDHGGWCPKGRPAADGPLPPKYLLQETESAGYRQRTKRNVRDSDATLIFNSGELGGGTLLTAKCAQALNRPHHVFQLDGVQLAAVAAQVIAWLEEGRFDTLNVAGPGEQKRPGIYVVVVSVLDACLRMSSGLLDADGGAHRG